MHVRFKFLKILSPTCPYCISRRDSCHCRRFLTSNKLEHLKFKLEPIIGIKKLAGEVRKFNDMINLFFLKESSQIECFRKILNETPF